MRIVSANIFCLNPTPRRALEAVAAQGGDVTILIEATRRFDRVAERVLPERRGVALPRMDGMPIAVHAAGDVDVEVVRDGRMGWVEAHVGGMTLLGVHMVAPYLPWRISRRYRQLMSLSERLGDIGEGAEAVALGDFNTADFEGVWRRFEEGIRPWRRLDHRSGDERARRRGARGTWPLGTVWSPWAVDHALAAPVFGGSGNGEGNGNGASAPARAGDSGESALARAVVRTFAIPGSDHLGLVVDLPGVGAGARNCAG